MQLAGTCMGMDGRVHDKTVELVRISVWKLPEVKRHRSASFCQWCSVQWWTWSSSGWCCPITPYWTACTLLRSS